MLQKRFITVLFAVSIPLASVLTAPAIMVGGDQFALTACAANKKQLAAVDYNAGADPSGYQPDSSKRANKDSGASSDGDLERSDSPSAGVGTDTSSNPAPGESQATPAGTSHGTAGGTTGDDGSVDSMWNSDPYADVKAKPKKKPREKTKSSSRKKDTDKASAGANAGASGDEAGTATAATPSAAPSPSPATPSDFGAYPAADANSTAPISTTGKSVLDQPVSSIIFGDSKKSPKSTSPATPPTTSTTTTTTKQASTVSRPAAAAQPVESPVKQQVETRAAATAETPPATVPTKSTPAAEPVVTTTTVTTPSRASEITPAASSLCTTRNFFQSELVRTVSWPGVGPFKGDSDPNDLADPQDNKLTLKTDGDKLASAELFLMHQPGNPQGFINLQMVMDFMLEALGTKDKRINDFNTFLEKHKDKVIKKQATEEKPLITSAGPYIISIASSGANNESSYLVQIKSKNSEASTDSGDNSGTTGDTTKATSSTGDSSSAPKTTVRVNTTIASATANPTKRPPGEKTQAPKTNQSTQSGQSAGQSSGQTVAPNDSLKQEFIDTIRGWQTVKKAAVRNCDAAELSKILTGKALDKQTLAIGWLVKKKDYYELTPKGVTVDRYEEISQAPKRYAVFAQVKEFSRLMDQTTNKMLSESDDAYKVKYTIEKTGDHWSIYDSDLIKSTATVSGGDQSKATTKPKR